MQDVREVGRRTTRVVVTAWAALVTVVLVLGVTAGTASAASSTLGEGKLRTLDYTDGLLSTGSIGLLDPQVVTLNPAPGAITSQFDPQVCMKSGGGLDKGIVDGASNTYTGRTTNAFTAAFSFASEKQAKAYMQFVQDRIDACDSFVLSGTAFTLTPPALPKVGDQVASFRASGTTPSFTLNTLQLFERKGQFVSYLSLVTSEELVDAALVKTLNDQKAGLSDVIAQTKPKKKS